jgi:hypothetical protein
MFSRTVRQVHMYLALFLAPWMLMYALSTIVMNHRETFRQRYGGELVRWVVEREQTLESQFSPGAKPALMAEQILRELDLSGNFNANLREQGKKLVIVRTGPVTPRRISYTPADGKLLVEKQEFRVQPFLESLHRRRGYQSSMALDDTWAVSVDAVIVAMIFWVLSGLWMWWEMKTTRRLGAVFMLLGLALFGLLLFTI